MTARTINVGDPNMHFGASVVSLAHALPYFSCRVFQGRYADNKTATASQRVFTKFILYNHSILLYCWNLMESFNLKTKRQET